MTAMRRAIAMLVVLVLMIGMLPQTIFQVRAAEVTVPKVNMSADLVESELSDAQKVDWPTSC